jgi:hypothetical protein
VLAEGHGAPTGTLIEIGGGRENLMSVSEFTEHEEQSRVPVGMFLHCSFCMWDKPLIDRLAAAGESDPFGQTLLKSKAGVIACFGASRSSWATKQYYFGVPVHRNLVGGKPIR